MRYLECIAMLEFLLKKLHSGQRTQVPVTVADDAQQVMVQLNRKLADNQDTELRVKLRDTMEAIAEVNNVQGILVLTDAMKQALVSGVTDLLNTLQLLAFDYFKYNDFEPTEEVIPIMRNVVATALARGVI